MPIQKTQLRTIYFFGLLLIVLLLTITIFLPYLPILAMAGTLAVLMKPAYLRLVKKFRGYESLASLVIVILTIFLILLPLTLIIAQIAVEATQLYTQLSTGEGIFARNYLAEAQMYIRRIAPALPVDLNRYAGQVLGWITANLGSFFAGTIQTVLHLFLGLMAFFYLLRDGNKLVDSLISLSPLRDEHDYKILDRLELAINSIIRGSLFIALLQGISSGIGMAIFGIPNPALWGSIAAVSALVPSVGTALVLAPAIGYLFLTDHIAAGIGLIVWSVTAVGLIDNFLGPMLVGRGIKIHPLFVLFSVIGGIRYFGPAGFILGPLTISLLYALLDIYRLLMGGKQTAETDAAS